MRSPQRARFPSRLAMALITLVVAAGCTEDPAPTVPQPTPSVSPAPTRTEGDGNQARGEGRVQERTVSVRDRAERRTVRGAAPPFVEIDRASVDGSVDRLVFAVELAGRIPDRMPDRVSVLRVTFTVTTATKRRYTFEAQGVRAGWGAYASGGPEGAPAPGLAIRGSRLEIAVDPAYIGGLQPFDWMVNVAWTSGEANYAFDAAPEEGFASYP